MTDLKTELKHLRGVVFDLDGTLYDNKRLPLHLILADPRHMFILQAERKARKSIKGRDLVTQEAVYDSLFSLIAAANGCTREHAADWYHNRYMPLQAAVLSLHYVPRPLVRELFEAIRAQGKKVVIFSDYGSCAEKLEALGIEPAWVDHVFDAPSFGGLKPCREAFTRMLEAAGLIASETLMVGDRDDTDGEGARRVGMQFFNVKQQKDAWDDLLAAFFAE